VLAAFIITASLTALVMEAAGTSETSINIYQTAWVNISEDIFIRKAAVEKQKFTIKSLISVFI
jgi:hypothetical protein